MIAAATALIQLRGDGVERRMSAFNRSVLFIVLAVAAWRSLYGFLQPQTPAGATGVDGATWVYLALAVITALSLLAYQRLPAFRTCAFALPTLALGISFLVLDFRTRLGWTIVVGTAVASAPLIVLELLRACAPRRPDVPEDGQVDNRR